MARVEQRVHIHRPVSHVWAVLTDWEAQPRWMQDAKSVTVTSAHRVGEGVTIRVPTNIAFGVVVMDTMEVTGWEEERCIAVRHTGKIIRGHGAFELRPTAMVDGSEGSLFTWWEEVDAPLGKLGDAVANAMVMPYVGRIFRRSLAALKAVAEETVTA